MKIDRWDFEHQEYYYYKNLVKIPAGYTVHSTHVFDNRSSNHHNPNSPPQFISVGLNTDDEMLFDGFQYLDYQPGDENINIDSILKNDPLLVLDIPEFEITREIKYSVIPNPITSDATIQFNPPLNESNHYTVNLYDKMGRPVLVEYTFTEGHIHLETILAPPGTYFFEVLSDGHRFVAGRLVYL